MSEDRRNPYQPFDASLIRDFLQGRELLSVVRFSIGKSNTSYKLTMSGGETCVLRIYSHGDGDREAHVMDLVRSFVPVPVQLARADTWSVFSFLEGELLQDVPQHSGAAAEALARISSVAFTSGGWINVDGSVSPFSFEAHGGFDGEMLAHSDVRTWIGPERAGEISEIMRREAARFAELDGDSRLVHGDFNPTNILILDGAVSGVLDWEFSHSGTPYMDIGNLLRNTDARYHGAIESGLEEGGMGLPSDWKERAELVDLSSQLEFLTSSRSDAFKRQCVARIDAFIRKFR